ncbi:MAG: hypothetical protein M1331_02500 [Candidatus Marsarchaeota archaeon]|nr:hypothetical protein [Candidatus Marsarchaeota archaeon]MCL5106240.1 hypothetical protein [Candidatus Marsarchaeota archaeon]
MDKLINATKKALNIIMHPNAVNEQKGIRAALRFYYAAAAIPGAISVILSGLVFLKFGAALNSAVGVIAYESPAMLFAIGLLVGLSYIFILAPLNAIISSAIYQFFAKRLFKIWTMDISRTFLACLYATFPMMFFVWTIFMPVVNLVADIIIGLWAFVILIILLAKQQKISRLRAFGGVLLSLGIIALISFAVGIAAAIAGF